MSTPNSSAEEWPADAAPEKWVAALFEKMLRMWGNRFLDQWRDTNLAGVKIEWGKALRRLSTAELKAGVDGLINLRFPPTVPEFYAMCKSRRLVEMASQMPLIEDKTKADPVIVDANMRRMREALAPLMQPRDPTAEWAYKLLMRGTSRSGGSLTYEVIRCASDAISSSAGRFVVENCADAELRDSYRTIREAVLAGYRNAGRELWEVK